MPWQVLLVAGMILIGGITVAVLRDQRRLRAAGELFRVQCPPGWSRSFANNTTTLVPPAASGAVIISAYQDPTGPMRLDAMREIMKESFLRARPVGAPRPLGAAGLEQEFVEQQDGRPVVWIARILVQGSVGVFATASDTPAAIGALRETYRAVMDTIELVPPTS